jgi:hypothetical protein
MSARFKISPDAIASRVTPDEMVLVQLQNDQMYVLNRTAARVWELLAAGCDRAEIERRLLAEFQVAEDVLAAQVGQLLTSLEDQQLIHRDGHDD